MIWFKQQHALFNFVKNVSLEKQSRAAARVIQTHHAWRTQSVEG